ncbi:MAG: saccharopine dehydrogenase NADP-binding domain-containing protein [Nannocystis sp.]|uniref:saccharopine dehydrogenase family protein n=1 Tax=Nannocystis sp. TaxID=1962667 RepID=UPI002421904C|nr:saccharopine dehydrogenase NADP-binding domain-containing protein [Nannocystis sp.]MBK9757231.1 saccharopine dehydrogenase NADP-binding domain-containing protein [Nannocystis sp.]
MTKPWLLYGANGYTGALIATAAAEQGLRPILAGRNKAAIEALAGKLGLEHRVFGLEDAERAAAAIEGAALVLHTAGPFSATSEPMLTACLRSRAHYLDITGEIAVFEACKARDVEAKARGVVVLPGVGFDVVPSDCLARALAEALPGAVRLEMAFQALGSMSRGTLKTMLEHIGRGVQVRRGGKIETIAAGSLQRTIEFSGKPRTVVAIGWGDVSTAYHSTGIGDITVSMAMPPGQLRGLKVLGLLAPLLRRPTVIRLLQAIVGRAVHGPSEQVRESAHAELWGQATAADGRTVEGRLRTPEGYKTTVITALACVQRLLAGGVEAGYQTPSSAFGAGLVRELPGFSLEIGGVRVVGQA